jgi:UDP-GlcNAc:undecaprenyl-phosphate/decaprenyl-phosphate GlcNAc-1-phosphate transferase
MIMKVMELLVFAGAFAASTALTRWVRDFANARGWNSMPDSDRHIHTHRIPRLGGIAIFLTLWCLALLAGAAEYFGAPGILFPHITFKILGPATVIFVVGLIDDFCGMNAYVKFVAQIGAAILLFLNGFGITRVSLMTGHPELGWLIGLPLTILWVLWITNAFNLIDGLDGLAAGSALFSALVTCIVALLVHNGGVLFLTLVLAGAIAGFLRYNFNPASIFLGDCGSLLIGFLLSAVALAGSQKAPTAIAVAIPIVSLGLPILDVTVAVLRRFLSGRRLFDADREHIHHMLLGRGIPHKQAVLLLYGVSACFGLLSLFLLHPANIFVIAVLMIGGVGVFFGVQQLHYHEFLELGHVANRTLHQRHVIANDITIRRAPEKLQTCKSLLQFCQILEQCLKPAGFDGFGLCLNSDQWIEPETNPFTQINDCKFRFIWNRSLRLSETSWSLSLSLAKGDGDRLGTFVLYRKNTTSPLLLDLEVLTVTGFSGAVAAIVEKKQNSWFATTRKARPQRPSVGSGSPGIASPISRPAEMPSSS